MDAVALLGDILAEALRSQIEAPPLSDVEAQQLAAWDLARQLSAVADLSQDTAYTGLCAIPDNMLSLLHSPQGWSALASYVAADHGLGEPSLMPTIH